MSEPAKSIIKAFGGADAVAAIVGRNRASVFRWTYEKEKGGTGGLIPAECQAILYANADKADTPLTAQDFLPFEGERAGTAA